MRYGLTDREVQVLRLAMLGTSDNECGRVLFVSPLTVAKHLENIAAKMGVESREEVIARAKEEGL
jgi:DNA-binding CsgD family transcriptional regulator